MAGESKKPSALRKHFLDFDIDNYLNPICPRQRFYLLPRFVSHWFGYRAPTAKPQPRIPNIAVWTSALIGSFIGIAIVTNVFIHLPILGGHQAPLVIASFGAAAILEYNVIESPLSQPRNLIFGHFLSAVIGVAVTKGFERLPAERFQELRWLAGSIAVGLASFVMGMTKTIHPPAGATALLAATNTEITVLGWWLLPLVLLASVLMCASALLVNNLTRRWPLYWWTPADLSKPKTTPEIEHVGDLEKRLETGSETETQRSASQGSTDAWKKWSTKHIEHQRKTTQPHVAARTPTLISSGAWSVEQKGSHAEDSGFSEAGSTSAGSDHRHSAVEDTVNKERTILITGGEIVLPDWWEPSDWEKEVLETLRGKLQQRRLS